MNLDFSLMILSKSMNLLLLRLLHLCLPHPEALTVAPLLAPEHTVSWVVVHFCIGVWVQRCSYEVFISVTTLSLHCILLTVEHSLLMQRFQSI